MPWTTRLKWRQGRWRVLLFRDARVVASVPLDDWLELPEVRDPTPREPQQSQVHQQQRERREGGLSRE